MKVLIAEDDNLVRQLVSTLMTRWGYDFDLAQNGLEAVELAMKNSGAYDLCLFDIDMPVMKGSEAAKILRGRFSALPILAVSGNLEFKHRYRDFGINEFLSKPYRPAQLQEKIRTLTIQPLLDPPPRFLPTPPQNFQLRRPHL